MEKLIKLQQCLIWLIECLFASADYFVEKYISTDSVQFYNDIIEKLRCNESTLREYQGSDDEEENIEQQIYNLLDYFELIICHYLPTLDFFYKILDHCPAEFHQQVTSMYITSIPASLREHGPRLQHKMAYEIGSPEQRIRTIKSVLHSDHKPVIKRLPELAPLSDIEQACLINWANKKIAESRSVFADFNWYFIFDLLIKCQIYKDFMINLVDLYQNKIGFDIAGLIKHIISSSDPISKFNHFQITTAASLLKETQLKDKQDLGKHLLMNAASTADDWLLVAKKFTEPDAIDDLRQKVFLRFIEECPDQQVLGYMVDVVVAYCLAKIEKVPNNASHLVATEMHWVLAGLSKFRQTGELAKAVGFFKAKFGCKLTRSVQDAINKL